MTDWTDPAWVAEAHEWIRDRLGARGTVVVGSVAQEHVRPWATVMRVPTNEGDVFFKANAAELRYETALVRRLAARRPDCVPRLLAVDEERGWMLMRDAGARLREIVERERDLTPWLEILPLYAGLQRDMSPDADALVALGVPDLRLATLVPAVERFLEEIELPSDERERLSAAVPQIRDLCERLAAYGVAETIQHDDLHDAQVFVDDGHYRILDWGDACVSHPFFTLSVTLLGVLAWGLDDVQGSVDVRPFRDAYLGPFAQDAALSDLRDASELAMWLGWICRAVNGSFGEPDLAPTLARVRMFLDARASPEPGRDA
jgi:hypothetical protein